MAAGSQILTCNEQRWKYFLRSGHWRIPGEASIDSWKECNVDFIEGVDKKRTVSLQVALQAQCKMRVLDAVGSSTQPAIDEDPPFQASSDTKSMVRMLRALLFSISPVLMSNATLPALCRSVPTRQCGHNVLTATVRRRLRHHLTPTLTLLYAHLHRTWIGWRLCRVG